MATNIGMALDLQLNDSVEMFKVENSILRIEESKNPDLEKVKVLTEDLQRLYKDFRLDKIEKIQGLHYDDNKGLNVLKEQTPKELIKQITRAEHERHDTEAVELTKVNAMNLATHYKYYYTQIAPIIRYLEFTINLVKRISTVVKVVDNYKLKEELDQLRETIYDLESEKGLMEAELREQIRKLEFTKTELTKVLFNQSMFSHF